jgi:hypothetical protein
MNYDYYCSSFGYMSDTCTICGTPNSCNYGELYCSEYCRAETLPTEEKYKLLGSLKLKENLETIKKLEQENRIINLVSSHIPKYQPTTDSVVFYWFRNSGFKDFFGRWKKNKIFVFGTVSASLHRRTSSLLELEEWFHSGKVTEKYVIKDHLGNTLSFEDALYYAITSSVNTEKQLDTEHVFNCSIGKIQVYEYAGGLEP